MKLEKGGNDFMVLYPGHGEVLSFPTHSTSLVAPVVQDP